MKHLNTVDFLRDLARRVDGDYDRDRIEIIADRLDVASLGEVRRILDDGHPAPGSTMGLAGATITHRPDLVYTEAQRQAASQGEAGYLPAKRALEEQRLTKAAVPHGAGGEVQQPEPPHAAEPAMIGMERR